MKPKNSPMKMFIYFQARRAFMFIAWGNAPGKIHSLSLALPRFGGGWGGGFICQPGALPRARNISPLQGGEKKS